MTNVTPPSGPHVHGGGSMQRIMLTVVLTLAPAMAWGVYQFGWPALNLLVVTIATALACEAMCVMLVKKPVLPTLGDNSALLTACLLAMSLPPWAPWWIGVFGGIFAIAIGKHVFGGIGQNVFNPAMLARVALLVAFPLEMTTWVNPAPLAAPTSPDFAQSINITWNGIENIDSVSSATTLGHIKTGLTQQHSVNESLQSIDYNAFSAFLGTTGGSLGETSALLILLGGLFLLFKRIITWHIPVTMIATMAILSALFHLIQPERYADSAVHLLSGGLMLGAFFIATDPVTSPSTKMGQMIFGAGCGALDFAIRVWGGYPEGIGFAVLLMNGVTPLIDHYVRPRIYGRDRHGAPIKAKGGDKKRA